MPSAWPWGPFAPDRRTSSSSPAPTRASSPLTFAGFCTLRALSTDFNDSPEKASRPFSRTRDGFVMGEGAGALILESLAHAKKRKARIYAEVAGYAATSEAYHMVIPREDGIEISITMAMALRNAGVRPAQVDYINAHATSTTIGDAVEIKAIKHLFKRPRGADSHQCDEIVVRPHPRRGRRPGGHHLRDDARHRPDSPDDQL